MVRIIPDCMLPSGISFAWQISYTAFLVSVSSLLKCSAMSQTVSPAVTSIVIGVTESFGISSAIASSDPVMNPNAPIAIPIMITKNVMNLKFDLILYLLCTFLCEFPRAALCVFLLLVLICLFSFPSLFPPDERLFFSVFYTIAEYMFAVNRKREQIFAF